MTLRRAFAWSASLALALASAGIGDAASPRVKLDPMARCAELTGRRIEPGELRLQTRGARIVSAVMRPVQGVYASPDYVPVYCDVRGEIDPVDRTAGVIKFGLALPLAWNGEAMQIGGNGMLGFVPWLAALNRNGAGSPAGPTALPNAPYPIARGYATFGDDSGHVVGTGAPPGLPGGVPPSNGQATMGGPPPMGSFEWAANPETLLNFAYQSIRKDHDTAIAVMKRFYGRAPSKTFYLGESHGGRQSIEAIGRYGDDYDGVLASVPLAYLTELWLYDMRNATAEAAPGGWLSPAKLAVVQSETLRECDELDGLKDGVVLNYLGCARALDPSAHTQTLAAIRCPDGADTGPTCLSDAQIRTVVTIRSPLHLPYSRPGIGDAFPGSPVGGEATLMGPWSPVAPEPGRPNLRSFPMLKGMLALPDLTPATFDPVRLTPRLEQLADELDAPVDWRAFFAHGGKVILHTSGDDYLTNANAQMALYRAVVARAGAATVERDMRYYVTPGGDHGSRSFSFPDRAPQARQMNLVGLLTAWVENGVTPPDAVPQVLMQSTRPYAITRARLLCRYPTYPRYLGSGDPSRSASYRCTAP